MVRYFNGNFVRDDGGVLWGPPCDCGVVDHPHRHGWSGGAATTRPVSRGEVDVDILPDPQAPEPQDEPLTPERMRVIDTLDIRPKMRRDDGPRQ